MKSVARAFGIAFVGLATIPAPTDAQEPKAITEKLPDSQILFDFSGRWIVLDRKRVSVSIGMTRKQRQTVKYWSLGPGEEMYFTFNLTAPNDGSAGCAGTQVSVILTNITGMPPVDGGPWGLLDRPRIPTPHKYLSQFVEHSEGFLGFDRDVVIYQIDDPFLHGWKAAPVWPYCKASICNISSDIDNKIRLFYQYPKSECGLDRLVARVRDVTNEIQRRVVNRH